MRFLRCLTNYIQSNISIRLWKLIQNLVICPSLEGLVQVIEVFPNPYYILFQELPWIHSSCFHIIYSIPFPNGSALPAMIDQEFVSLLFQYSVTNMLVSRAPATEQQTIQVWGKTCWGGTFCFSLGNSLKA